MSSRLLPVLDQARARPAGTAPAPPAPRLAEFATEDVALPRFHVWTLGCQMNHSDSEEMAGALLAAGCAEAESLESADLIVINTCAIREAAEQKVIGRMGQLALLHRANPALRVVMTGCSVRANNTASPAGRRRVPARGSVIFRDGGRTTRVTLCCRGRSARAPRVGRVRVAADHLRLRQDVYLLHRALQPRAGTQPALRRGGRRGTLAGLSRLP
jgi:hypothetical protein